MTSAGVCSGDEQSAHVVSFLVVDSAEDPANCSSIFHSIHDELIR